MLKALSLWETIDKRFLLKPLEVVEAQSFVMQLAGILKLADEAMSEEADALTYELILSDFFENIFGLGSTSCRSNITFQHTEIATYQDETCKLLGLVVPPDQRISMITRRQINKPVFHQAICSYLFEYFQKGNHSITHIWISNVLEWFLFDVAYIQTWLQQEVTEGETLWDLFELTASEPEQWMNILTSHWKKIEQPISATVFNLYGFQEQLTQTDGAENDKLLALQKLLSPTHLLKVPYSPSKTYPSLFFQELLHLIGVEEVVQKNGNRLRLITHSEGLYHKFDEWLDKLKGDSEEMVDTWYTCTAFICQLILHKAIEAHRSWWIDSEEEDFVPTNFKDRLQALSQLPILGEYQNDISAASFDFSFEMRIHANTILKDRDQGSLQHQTISAADYLSQWLDAYEFVFDYRPRIQQERTFLHIDDIIHLLKRLSDLDTSHPYVPPTFIADLCKAPLRESVIRVFNSQQGWACVNFEELETKIAKIPVKKANACMDHLTVCNPASGNGDIFLYCFEEWLRIKMQLGILCDGNGEFLPYYPAYNDDIHSWWLDDDGAFYIPDPDNAESLRLISAMRHEFEHVFGRVFLGVEASPLWVSIAYTRLYLLYIKFASPPEEGSIHFPPLNNNVRQANPLVSRFPLDLDIQKALAPTPYGFEDYKYVVQLMKIARSSIEIEEAQHMLKQFKQLFRAHVSSSDRRQKRLEKLEQIYHQEFMTLTLLSFGGQDTERDEKRVKMEEEINRLKAELKDEASGGWYKNAFEWRLEFPEILDAQGNFVGFDLVICLPPSLRQDQTGTLRHYFKQRYKTYNYQAKLFMYYVELGLNLLKPHGHGVLILPKAWTQSQYAQSLRNWIVNFQLQHIEEISIPQLHQMGKLIISNLKKKIELKNDQSGEHKFQNWLGE